VAIKRNTVIINCLDEYEYIGRMGVSICLSDPSTNGGKKRSTVSLLVTCKILQLAFFPSVCQLVVPPECRPTASVPYG
jgi:hypothetical protein